MSRRLPEKVGTAHMAIIEHVIGDLVALHNYYHGAARTTAVLQGLLASIPIGEALAEGRISVEEAVEAAEQITEIDTDEDDDENPITH
jgi:fido (protein-threonine AMPylation protein)